MLHNYTFSHSSYVDSFSHECTNEYTTLPETKLYEDMSCIQLQEELERQMAAYLDNMAYLHTLIVLKNSGQYTYTDVTVTTRVNLHAV
jgi:hypothetical protein